MGPRVFVDAKILRRHEKTVPKDTVVAYTVENQDIVNFCKVRADDPDDAELQAVAFAIRELSDRYPDFRIVTDNESVFSVIDGKNRKAGRKRPVLLEILDELEAKPSIRIELLEKNPAHKALNKYVRDHPEIDSRTKP